MANILGGEMNIHRGYMSRLGITEEDAERVKPSLNNESYTSYMRVVAARGRSGGDYGGCAFVHSAMNTSPSGSSPTTRTPISMSSTVIWVQGYASEDYARQKTASWSLIWSVW